MDNIPPATAEKLAAFIPIGEMHKAKVDIAMGLTTIATKAATAVTPLLSTGLTLVEIVALAQETCLFIKSSDRSKFAPGLFGPIANSPHSNGFFGLLL